MDEKQSKALKIISIIYYVLAGITLLLLIGFIAFANVAKPAIEAAFSSMNIDGVDPQIVISVSLGFEVAFYVLYGWLASRVANKKSKGTVFMVLLILSVLTGLIAAIRDHGISRIFILVLDALALYYVILARKNS